MCGLAVGAWRRGKSHAVPTSYRCRSNAIFSVWDRCGIPRALRREAKSLGWVITVFATSERLLFHEHVEDGVDSLGLPDVSSHSFRKTVATLIDDSGLSARVGADQLGHARPSMTQDVYMSRGTVHTEVAAALDKAMGINIE